MSKNRQAMNATPQLNDDDVKTDLHIQELNVEFMTGKVVKVVIQDSNM